VINLSEEGRPENGGVGVGWGLAAGGFDTSGKFAAY
jgi:hypothetical protein